MTDQIPDATISDLQWKSLCIIGGAAALIAGVLFRRNIAAEVGLFTGQIMPDTASSWFALLQSNRLLGLVSLNIFDLVNYAFVGLMYLALYVVLKRANGSYMAIGTALAFLGIGAYFASNTAFSMLSLSDQYAAATTEPQRTMLAGAGQAMLALSRFSSPGAHPGAAGYASLLLIAIAGMITSVVMIRSTLFNRPTAYVGILASSVDLAYCTAYVFVPAVGSDLLAVYFMPVAGLFLMIWHILIGLRLLRLGRGISSRRARSSA